MTIANTNICVKKGTVTMKVNGVVSHISWEWGCAYMYKGTLLDTTLFKVMMTMTLSEFRS
jgi:hypothetical protein